MLVAQLAGFTPLLASTLIPSQINTVFLYLPAATVQSLSTLCMSCGAQIRRAFRSNFIRLSGSLKTHFASLQNGYLLPRFQGRFLTDTD
jgi:hypothetical protein